MEKRTTIILQIALIITNWIRTTVHIKGIPIFATNMHSLSDTDTLNLATGLKAYPGDLHVSSKDVGLPLRRHAYRRSAVRRQGTMLGNVC